MFIVKGIYAYSDTKYDSYCYVGRDSNIDKSKRYYDHKSPCHYNKQPFNRVLQNNPKRYEYHKLVELSDDFTDDDLNDLESLFIKELDTYYYENPYGFNFTMGGDGCTGYKLSKAHRKKLREAHLGKKHSEETKKKISEINKGRKHSLESIKKMSESKKGHFVSDETKNKISKTKTKNYARVIKNGHKNGKQQYALRYNGKIIQRSINEEKLQQLANELN